MNKEPFYTPNRKPDPPRNISSRFFHGHDRYLCELRDHGRYGVEAQFVENEEFRVGRRFDTRALAVQWAEAERKNIEKGAA